MKKQLKFTVDEYLYKEFERIAIELNLSKIALLRLMILEFVKNYKY